MNTTTNSPTFNLNAKDVAKGLVTAVIVAVLVSIYQIVSAPNFDLFTLNWSQLAQVSINSAVAALFGYLFKNFISDSQGKVLGKIG